jgi:hypothetical protein
MKKEVPFEEKVAFICDKLKKDYPMAWFSSDIERTNAMYKQQVIKENKERQKFQDEQMKRENDEKLSKFKCDFKEKFGHEMSEYSHADCCRMILGLNEKKGVGI